MPVPLFSPLSLPLSLLIYYTVPKKEEDPKSVNPSKLQFSFLENGYDPNAHFKE